MPFVHSIELYRWISHAFMLFKMNTCLIGRIHDGPVSCLAVSDDQMIVGGSSIGSITVSDLSSDQRLATLKSFSTAGSITKLTYQYLTMLFHFCFK